MEGEQPTAKDIAGAVYLLEPSFTEAGYPEVPPPPTQQPHESPVPFFAELRGLALHRGPGGSAPHSVARRPSAY